MSGRKISLMGNPYRYYRGNGKLIALDTNRDGEFEAFYISRCKNLEEAMTYLHEHKSVIDVLRMVYRAERSLVA